MKTYKGSQQIWDAFKEGKRLSMNPNHNVKYYKMHSYDEKYDANIYTLHIDKVKFYFSNPQMNCFSACLEKDGTMVDADLDLWDLNNSVWYDYDELQTSLRKEEVQEITIQQIQDKLGYKIKIVE